MSSPTGTSGSTASRSSLCRPKLGFSAVDLAEHEVDRANESDHDLVVIDRFRAWRRALDGLRRVDGVTAGNRNASCIAHRRVAENSAHHLCRDLVDRHAENCQRHDRRSAHRVDERHRTESVALGSSGGSPPLQRARRCRDGSSGTRPAPGSAVSTPSPRSPAPSSTRPIFAPPIFRAGRRILRTRRSSGLPTPHMSTPASIFRA
jgi:hypothetical protein